MEQAFGIRLKFGPDFGDTRNKMIVELMPVKDLKSHCILDCMKIHIFKSIYCYAALLFALPVMVSASQHSVFDTANKSETVTVSILALSTSIHLGSGNEDVYLVDLITKDQSHHFAKLVDSYSNLNMPVPRAVLQQRKLLRMKVTRDTRCDQLGKRVFMRTGDEWIFDTGVSLQLEGHRDSSIPCYHAQHDSIRFVKDR